MQKRFEANSCNTMRASAELPTPLHARLHDEALLAAESAAKHRALLIEKLKVRRLLLFSDAQAE